MIFFNRNNPNLAKYVPDIQLRKNTLTFVYQSKNGFLGFDEESGGEKFLELFQNQTDLLWQPATGSFKRMPFGIYEIRQHLSFVIHRPKSKLIEIVENHTEAIRIAKTNALRERYGKKGTKIEPSIFNSLWDPKKCFVSKSGLREILMLSEYISAWRLNEFGLYFFVIDCGKKVLNLNGFNSFPTKEEENIDDIPVF